MILVRGLWMTLTCFAILTAGIFSPAAAAPSLHEEPEKHVWEGKLVCSVAYTTGFHPYNCPQDQFPEQDDRLALPIGDGIKSVVVAMEWDVPTIALTDTVRNWLYIGDQSWERHIGPPPLEYRYDAPEEGPPSLDFEMRVWAGGGGGNLNVVHDMDFTVHYHLFYDDWAPDDYSALPE